MVYIQLEKEVEVLVTDEGEFFTLGGVLYQDYLAVSYEHDAEQEYYVIKDQEIDNLQEGKDTGSYIEVRRMQVWEEA